MRGSDKADLKMRIFAARIALSNAVQDSLEGEAGAFAAAIISGDRSGMSQNTLAALRGANLAHLLSISGLHMGLLTAFVFGLVRYGLVLIPGVGLRLPVKKIGAVFALVVGAFYLALSGGNVATGRAYIMVAMMFLAVLLGRRALTLRAVAMAAIIVLIFQPDALPGPGFQMSFSATTALVVMLGVMKKVDLPRLPKWSKPILSVVMSSFFAGIATAPFAAAHFNQIVHYGLIANLLSVPLMGIIIMPAAVLAVCLAPIGLWDVRLWIMAQGLKWILSVAHAVTEQEGAVGHVIAPPAAVLPLLAIAFLWLVLWQGQIRFIGLVGIIAAFGLWMTSTRPAILVDDSGGLIGQMGSQGRILSKPRGSGFVAGVWLENDGQPVVQEIAAARAGFVRQGRVVSTMLGDWRITQVSGKTAAAEIVGCAGADVIIFNTVIEDERPCIVYDVTVLRQSGSLAFDLRPDGALQIRSARNETGLRPWNAQGRNDTQTHAVLLQKKMDRQGGPSRTVSQLLE